MSISIEKPGAENSHFIRIIGNWQLLREIGTGAYGTVYEAQHSSIAGKRAAVKVLHQKLSSDSAIKARFLKEASAVSLARHPSIVQVFDCGISEDGSCYIVMELLSGTTLAELLRQDRLTETKVIHIGIEIARALAVAHAHGIIHRDIKPDNIFISQAAEAHEVKIVDFGVAKFQDQVSSTRSGTWIGTRAYMSPEQWKTPSDIDGRADIYALGIILYECLVGRLPFEADSDYAWLMAHTESPAPDPAASAPISAPLGALIWRMLAKERELRPGTMQEVVLQLERCLRPPVSVPKQEVAPVSVPRQDVVVGPRRGNLWIGALALSCSSALSLSPCVRSTPPAPPRQLQVKISNLEPNTQELRGTVLFHPDDQECVMDGVEARICETDIRIRNSAGDTDMNAFDVPLSHMLKGTATLHITAFDKHCSRQFGQISFSIDSFAADRTLSLALKTCYECWCDYCADPSPNCTREHEAVMFNDIKGLPNPGKSGGIWAAADRGKILYWNGTTWIEQNTYTDTQINGLAVIDENDVWAVGGGGTGSKNGIILHWNGAAWSNWPDDNKYNSMLPILHTIYPTSPETLSIVGGCGVKMKPSCSFIAQVLTKDAILKRETIGSDSVLTKIRSVWQNSFSERIWAVGGTGEWNPTSEKYIPIKRCPSNENKIGHIFSRSNRSSELSKWIESNFDNVLNQEQVCNLTWIWGSAPDDIWAVGEYGAILHWDGSLWSSKRNDDITQGRSLWSIWGNHKDDVWAVGASAALTSPDIEDVKGIIIHWDGIRWERMKTPSDVKHIGVWSRSSKDVWVVGQGKKSSILRYQLK